MLLREKGRGLINFLALCFPGMHLGRNEIAGFVRVGHSFRANGGVLGHFSKSRKQQKGGDRKMTYKAAVEKWLSYPELDAELKQL